MVNPSLVRYLKAAGLWDNVMVNDLKYFDGSVQQIDRILGELKTRYATAFEIDPRWLVEAAAGVQYRRAGLRSLPVTRKPHP